MNETLSRIRAGFPVGSCVDESGGPELNTGYGHSGNPVFSSPALAAPVYQWSVRVKAEPRPVFINCNGFRNSRNSPNQGVCSKWQIHSDGDLLDRVTNYLPSSSTRRVRTRRRRRSTTPAVPTSG